jgi:hypothetical protein
MLSICAYLKSTDLIFKTSANYIQKSRAIIPLRLITLWFKFVLREGTEGKGVIPETHTN